VANAGMRTATITFAVSLALGGCSAGSGYPPPGPATAVGASSDVNPQNPATLRDGGDLRLALTEFPSNFNTLHIDGNSADVGGMLKATLPRAFVIGPDGSTTVDTDYFSSVELTGTNPQTVTYTFNPKATWSDGAPLGWEDIASQIHATSGVDKNFAIAGTNGSERVKSVTRGVDDRQAVVTFAKPYAEWRGMFAGNTMLLPKSMTATPEAFNKGQLSAPGPSAGPFVVSSLDRTRQRIVLTRNPKWWGERPRLDRITFLVLDDAARLPALQNKAIDATGLAGLDQMTIARRTKGISIRRAPTPSWYHFTFNGAKGSILADPALRRAVAEGIDRQSIAAVSQHGLTSNPAALNNHIFVEGQQGYEDNSGVVAYNPEKAMRDLDALGWKLNGRFRERNGQQLVIRDLFYDAQTSRQFGLIAQHCSRKPAAAFSPTTSTSVLSTSRNSVGWAMLFRCPRSRRSTRPTARATSARSAAPRSTPRSSRRSKSWILPRPGCWPTRSTS